MTKKPPASGRAIFRSWVDAYRKKNPSAKIIEQRPVHQRRSSMRSTATKRMYAKIAARTMAEIAAIANMTVVDSFGTSGPAGGGARVGSMGSALDRLAALRAELHVARDLVAVRAPQELGRAAFPAELQGGRDGLAALHARLDAERHEVRLRVREGALLDVVQAHREVDDLQAVRLHLAQGDVELLHDFVLDAVLDVRRCRGAERPNELVDERLRVLDPVAEVAEGAELDHVEVRVLEKERILRAELPVDDPLLEVVDLRLLDDAGEGFDESAQDRRVLRRESVAVRAVEVREDLAVAVEDRDLILANDEVVVHSDVSREFPVE